MEKIIVKEIKEFDLDLILKIKHLEIENLGKEASINEWVIPVIIKYGKIIAALQKESSNSTFVKEFRDNEIIGINEMIRKWDDCSCVFIHSFYVRTMNRNSGIGSRLLEESLKILRQSGTSKVELTVDPNNFAAVHLYEKFGFKVTEHIKDLYGKGLDRNIMAKNLTGGKNF